MTQEKNITIIKKQNGIKYTIRNNRDRFFYPGEWQNFIKTLSDNARFVYELLLHTGARYNEVKNIRINDIDFIHYRITLRYTKIKARAKEKSPRPRIIPISHYLAKLLRARIRKYNLKSYDVLRLPMNNNSNVMLKRYLKRAGIQDYYMFSCHNIRKTLEVWLMALNVDSLKIMAHIGHSTKTALSNYVSPDIFSIEEKILIRLILGDLYEK